VFVTTRRLRVQVTRRTKQVWGRSSGGRTLELKRSWTRGVLSFWICSSEPCVCADTFDDLTNTHVRSVDGMLSSGKWYQPFEILQWPYLQGQPLRFDCLTLKMKALRPFETPVFTSRHGVSSRKTWVFRSVDVRTWNLASIVLFWCWNEAVSVWTCGLLSGPW